MSIIGTRPPLISETNFYELHHRANNGYSIQYNIIKSFRSLKTVHKISLEEIRKGLENSEERNYNNFNTLMHENKIQGTEERINDIEDNEGGTDYGTDLSSQGGLPVSEPDRRGGRSDNREIRDAEENISEGTQEQPLPEPFPDREAESASSGDRESGSGENGEPDGEIAEEQTGTGQGSRSDGMDSTYERTDSNSRRVKAQEKAKEKNNEHWVYS